MNVLCRVLKDQMRRSLKDTGPRGWNHFALKEQFSGLDWKHHASLKTEAVDTDETPFFLNVSSSDDLHFDNRTALGVDQGSLPVEYEPHGLRIVDANWR